MWALEDLKRESCSLACVLGDFMYFFGFGWVFGNLGAILGSSTYRVSGRVSLFAAEAGNVRSFLAAHRVRSNDASHDLGAKGSGESCSKGGRFPCKA